VKSLIPKKTTRKEWSRWNRSKEVLWSFKDGLCPTPSFFGLLPETFVLLLILGCGRSIHDIGSMEKSNTTDEVGEHRFGEAKVLLGIEWRLGRKDLLESLGEGERSTFDLLSKCLS
jgi:hypothetical protein